MDNSLERSCDTNQFTSSVVTFSKKNSPLPWNPWNFHNSELFPKLFEYFQVSYESFSLLFSSNGGENNPFLPAVSKYFNWLHWQNRVIGKNSYNKGVPFFGVWPSSGSVLKCLFLFCLWLFIDMIMTGYGKLEKFPFSSNLQSNSAWV